MGIEGCEDGTACGGLSRGYTDVAIVPHADAEDADTCKYHKTYNYERGGNYYSMSDACHVLVPLKGPFNTEAEAEYVFSTWDELIIEYARTCACSGTCDGDELAYTKEEISGPVYTDPSGDAGITPAPGGCEAGYTW